MSSLILPWIMSVRIIRNVRSDVQRHLKEWQQRAAEIPDAELRRQALASIQNKAFHCHGGAVYALLAGPRYQEVLRFIVAYQTISDYLDNLCDRSTSLNPDDFSALHEAMVHALTPGASGADYYRFRTESKDGGYLPALVKTCQDVLGRLAAYPDIAATLQELAKYYCEVQVIKHIRVDERVPQLTAWFESGKDGLPDIRWYEYAACAGSTLGFFCLIAEAAQGCSAEMACRIKEAYFPWVQGLHILLDYLIDQEEDRSAGDLNFCACYPSQDDMCERLWYFFRQADASTARLPHAQFHRLIIRGLLGMYLADQKVSRQTDVRKVSQKLIRRSGFMTLAPFIFYRINNRLGL